MKCVSKVVALTLAMVLTLSVISFSIMAMPPEHTLEPGDLDPGQILFTIEAAQGFWYDGVFTEGDGGEFARFNVSVNPYDGDMALNEIMNNVTFNFYHAPYLTYVAFQNGSGTWSVDTGNGFPIVGAGVVTVLTECPTAQSTLTPGLMVSLIFEIDTDEIAVGDWVGTFWDEEDDELVDDVTMSVIYDHIWPPFDPAYFFFNFESAGFEFTEAQLPPVPSDITVEPYFNDTMNVGQEMLYVQISNVGTDPEAPVYIVVHVTGGGNPARWIYPGGAVPMPMAGSVQIATGLHLMAGQEVSIWLLEDAPVVAGAGLNDYVARY